MWCSLLTWVGHGAIGEDFVQEHPKGPDVRLNGEALVADGLGSCPLVGQLPGVGDVKGLLAGAGQGTVGGIQS